MRVELLGDGRDAAWEALVHASDAALVYHSLPYRDFLLDVLRGARAPYLVAHAGGELLGAMPLMVSGGEPPVVNALPFFGSHGAPFTRRGSDAEAVGRALLEGALQQCAALGAAALTVVENLFAPGPDIAAVVAPDFVDQRIGQFKQLPPHRDRQRDEQALFDGMHQKTRNLVRKGLREGFAIEVRDDDGAWSALERIHRDNLRAIGGRAKPPAVFAALRTRFVAPRERRLYVARDGDRVAAALLMLYCNGVAEYFTPVIDVEYRSRQPLSALVLRAMSDAVADGCRWWNWGGTWLGQEGVYRFKQRWGTQERRYRYHTRLWDRAILRHTSDALLERYPFFYVVPFAALTTS